MPRVPKFEPRRRNARVGPLTLPREGRKGDLPKWPLSTPSALETVAWKQLWATPHAVAWETLGWTRTVARYCRMMVAAEQPGAMAPLLGQVVKLEEHLGLTPKAMRLMLWQIGDGSEATDEPELTVVDIRERLKAVE